MKNDTFSSSIQPPTPSMLHFVTLPFVILILLLGLGFASPAWSKTCRILVFGDSLSAGYGLTQKHSFPSVLQQSLLDKQYNVVVINGGVSGDTTTSALARIEWQLFDTPGIAIVEIGANDMLRGLPNIQTEKNLNTIIQTFKNKNIPILLTGMRALPNMGEEYAQAFNAIYPRLASQHNVDFYPFFLEGVAANENLNLQDRIHPNPQGVREIVVRITPYVEKLMASCQQT